MSKINCAIYTRKSTEHGLDMEFNSLQNQEEACKAYILSQAFNGWEYYNANIHILTEKKEAVPIKEPLLFMKMTN